MTFNPTPAQIQLIIEHECAHMPPDKIAAVLGVDPADIAAWHQRLAAGRRLVVSHPKPKPAKQPATLEETTFRKPPEVHACQSETSRDCRPPDDAGASKL
jgi:hypothetical protein